jgi:nucleotide-binding universal stress UspA family protein
MTSARISDTPRVVVGVDGSEPSKNALRWAARFAETAGARIEAVAVWQYPASYGWAALPLGEWHPRIQTEKLLNETVDEVFGPQRPTDLCVDVLEGNTTKVLLEQSNGALLLVVGSRGHGGFAGLLLGSVSAGVAEHASCPVLVVHGNQGPPEARR